MLKKFRTYAGLLILACNFNLKPPPVVFYIQSEHAKFKYFCDYTFGVKSFFNKPL